MSKSKKEIEDLRNKLFEKKKEELVEKAIEVETKMENVVYDLIPDTSGKGRAYTAVKITYDLVTRKAQVEDVYPFPDKNTGFSMLLDKENRKYIFEQSRSKK